MKKNYWCLITALAVVIPIVIPWGENVFADELSQLHMSLPALNRKAPVSSKIRQAMRAADRSESSLRVIVRLRKKATENQGNHASGRAGTRVLRDLKRQMQSRHHNMSDFLQRVQSEHTDPSQKKIARNFPQRTPSKDRLHSFWIANSIAVSLSPREIEALAGHPDVVEIMENQVLSVPPVEAKSLPVIDSTRELWNLSAIGLDRLNDPDLNGYGVRVGHLDTGIDATHADFDGKLIAWSEFDPLGNKINSEPHETHVLGHGTHTASIMVGETTGVAPGASLLSAMVLPEGSGTLEQVLAGIEWLLDPDNDPATDDGAKIINMSWGMSAASSVLMDAIANMTAAGILPVCAIGNGGTHITYSPGNFPASAGVGAVDKYNEVPYFSSGGMIWWDNSPIIKPDITAPGAEVTGLGLFGEYQTLSGTSFAAPHVAGAAALLLQKNPDLNLAQLKGFLYNAALDLGMQGQDPEYGRGVMDVAASLRFMGRYAPRFKMADLIVKQTNTQHGFPFHIYETYFSDGNSKFLQEEMSHMYSFSSFDNSISKTPLGVADVNGDGYADLVISQSRKSAANAYLVEYLVHLSADAAGFNPTAETWYSFTSPAPGLFEFIGLADVNGDTNSDLLFFSKEQTLMGRKLHVVALLSNGSNAFVKPAEDWITINTDQYHTIKMGVGDVNGDRRADLVYQKFFIDPYDSYPADYYVSLSSGSRFGNARPWITFFSDRINGRPKYHAISDVNGDGLGDLILSGDRTYGNTRKKEVYVCRSNGSSQFFPKESWASMAWDDATSLETVTDVNGDGLGDLMVSSLDPLTNRWSVKVWLSKGQSKFVESEMPWLVLDRTSSEIPPFIAGVADIGMGDWSDR